MTALVTLLVCVAVVALALVARDVAIRAVADRADARTRAVQTDETFRADVEKRLKNVEGRTHELDAAIKTPRRVRA